MGFFSRYRRSGEAVQRAKSGGRRQRRFQRRLASFESLERRNLLASYVVTSTLDTIDASDGVTTFREAIVAANANSGADRIEFNIPGPGVHTIFPATSLPPITERVVIDGYTQPGASANSLANGNNAVLLIELSGTNPAIQGTGLRFEGSGTEVRGLVINGFQHGIWLAFDGYRIDGNFIGTDATGQIARANGNGISQFFASDGNIIGGPTPQERNVISGITQNGIALSSTNGNRVEPTPVARKRSAMA